MVGLEFTNTAVVQPADRGYGMHGMIYSKGTVDIKM